MRCHKTKHSAPRKTTENNTTPPWSTDAMNYGRLFLRKFVTAAGRRISYHIMYVPPAVNDFLSSVSYIRTARQRRTPATAVDT